MKKILETRTCTAVDGHAYCGEDAVVNAVGENEDDLCLKHFRKEIVWQRQYVKEARHRLREEEKTLKSLLSASKCLKKKKR